MKKIISVLLIAALFLSIFPLSVFAEGEVVSISYKTEYTEFVEDTDGEWDEQDNYFRYICNFHTGDILTVNYSTGESKDFVADFIDGEIYFVAENESPIKQWADIFTSHNQLEEHWVAGGSYSYKVDYMGKQTDVEVSVVPNPVVSISYAPKSGCVTRYFETGGEFDYDDNGQAYYRYNVIQRSQDDILTVNYNDGRGSVEYRLTFSDNARYVSTVDENDYIAYEQVDMYDEQWNEHFNLGNDNHIYVRYMGKSCTVPVSIVINPINSIVYTPVRDIEVIEFTNGRWEDVDGEQVYQYYPPWFSEGDQLAVTYSESGNTVVYTYMYHYDSELGYATNAFFDNEFNALPVYENSIYVGRDGASLWTKDGDNYMYVVYNDNRSNNVRVRIIDNPVKAIRYERNFEVEIVEGTHMYYDNWDEADYYSIPYHRNGDKLIIVASDDSETVYEYQDNGVFVCDGKDDIPSYDVKFSSDQRENPWSIGKHEYWVEYLGRQYSLPAKIIENPVKSISYTQAIPFEFAEDTNGEYLEDKGYYRYYYGWYDNGDKLTVNYNDDTSKEFVFKQVEGGQTWEYAFIAEDGTVLDSEDIKFFDKQDEVHWQLGSENVLYVEYLGATCEINVSITENNVKAIRYIPVSDPEVMTGCNSYIDYATGIEIFYEPYFKRGDQLTVIYKNDSSKTFTARFDRDHYIFTAEDGEEIDDNNLRVGSYQHMNPWTKDGDNEYYVEYSGAFSYIKCSVVENPVDSIEFIPANETVYLEGTNMFYDEWRERDIYEMPRVQDGDILVVNYKDPERGRVEYIAEFDSANNIMTYVSNDGDIIVEDEKFEFYDEQDVETWGVGEHYYTIMYCGKAAQVPVTIKENSIASISYHSVEIPQVWSSDFQIDIDEETGKEYRHYNIPDFEEGDILTITDTLGNSVDYVLIFDESDGERYFVNGDEKLHQYSLFRFDNQNEHEWTLGRGNYYSVDLYGFIADIEVEVIETDVESISFNPVNEIVLKAEKDGEFIYDEHGEKFYLYNQVQIVNAGDKLTVAYKDGNVVVYTLGDDGTGENWILRADDGREIDPREVDIDDHQWDNHWQAGTNHFDIVYHGVRATADVNIYVSGDINGDKAANNLDLVTLFQYLTGKDYAVNKYAIDVNGDGQLNNLDVVLLFQYLSGWDVQIH